MEKAKENLISNFYKPSEEEERILKLVYDDVKKMIDLRDQTWPQFNDRTLKQYIDDCEKRLNSYVPSRESQGKEEWQANVALPTIRDKVKKMIAGFSLQVPDLEVKAFGQDNQLSINRAEIARYLIQSSYLQEENPILMNFWETWECATKGTVVVYEGYLKTRVKQKYINSIDLATGKVDFEEKEVDIDDKCISYILPLTEFFIKDFFIDDVQEQPAVAWIRYYTKEMFDYEFGKYENAKYVLTGTQTERYSNIATFYYQKDWAQRAGSDRIEVIRYYNKLEDLYAIVANGVVLFSAPLLWKVNGRKVYPFAKTIWEPFAGKHFFYGKALPDILMGYYDILNTLFNTVMDKEFRSLVKPLLIGRVNQEMLDLEDEYITRTTKITVEDINQIREMQIEGPNSGDIAMIQLVASAIDETTPTIPALLASRRQITAREIVLAEEKLREIRSLYYEMLTDLWRQKYYLRLANIQTFYSQPRKIIDERGKEKEIYRTYLIPNAKYKVRAEDGSEIEERGILAIQFRKFKETEKKKLEQEASIEREVMKRQGIKYKKVIIPPNFLDNFVYQIEVIPASFYKVSLAKLQSTVLEKLEAIARLFPQIFAANQEEYFEELMKAYESDAEEPLKRLNQIKEAQQLLAQLQAERGTKRPIAPE